MGSLVAVGLVLEAAEFPFEVRELSAEEAMSLPGGHGAYGSLSAVKPPQARKAPVAKSKYPLFSALSRQGVSRGASDTGMLFWFDESQGTGKGYDRLVVDLNANGDLTDDPVYERMAGLDDGMGQSYERRRFGPVEMPEGSKVGAWRPRFYLETLVYNRELLGQGSGEMLNHIGQMRVRSGNMLVAPIEVKGEKHEIGIVDADVSFRIGDPANTTEFTRTPGGRSTWYLMPSDYLLRNWKGSGTAQDRAGQEVAEPLSSLVYFGKDPFSLEVAKDLKWIRIEPYAGATGQVDLGESVAWMILGRQVSGGSWEAVAPMIERGKAILPVGSYRVSNLALESRDVRKVRLTSYDVPLKPLDIAADHVLKVAIGTPIRLEVTAQKRAARPGEVSAGVRGAIRGMFGGRSRTPEETILELGVGVFGQADETYSGFSAAADGPLPPPRFEVFADGKPVGSGDFEYG